MSSSDWVAGGAWIVAIGAGLLNWFRTSAVMEERVERLTEGDKSLGADLKEAAKQLRDVATEIRVLSAEQAVINKIQTTTLEGLVEKMGLHERLIGEHSATITLMRELIMLRHDKDTK